MDMPDLFRRNALKLAISAACLMLLPACVTNPEKHNPGPISVDTQNVKDLDGLILAIRKAGGDLLPSSLTVQDWYKVIAKTFVDNARKAADLGMQVPQWVMDKLPSKKVAYVKDEVKPETVALVILGVIFLIPISLFFVIAFSSILTLTRYITEKLNEQRA